MTFAEIKRETEILYESINSSDAPGFRDSEWQIILNMAQRKVIWDILRKGLTKDAFTLRMLEPITVYESDSTPYGSNVDYYLNSDDSGALGFTLDEKVFWILDEYLKTDDYDRIPLKRITYDFYQDNLKNPYKKPGVKEDEKFWVISSFNSTNYNTVIISDGTTLTNPAYNTIGVEHPDENEIDIADGYTNGCSILSKAAHPLIVERAVKLAHLAVLDPEGFQLQLAESQLQGNY